MYFLSFLAIFFTDKQTDTQVTQKTAAIHPIFKKIFAVSFKLYIN